MKTITKYALVTIGIMFIIPFTVKADCSYEREAELSKIATNVQFSYTYDDQANFTITMTNLTDDIYIINNYGIRFSGTGEKTESLPSGYKAEYTIYSNDPACYGEKIFTQTINLPEYNNRSNSKFCQENPDFSYCGKWIAGSISTEKFDAAVAEYQQKKTENNTGTEEGINYFDLIINDKNFRLLMFGIIIFVILYIGAKFVSKKKGR